MFLSSAILLALIGYGSANGLTSKAMYTQVVDLRDRASIAMEMLCKELSNEDNYSLAV